MSSARSGPSRAGSRRRRRDPRRTAARLAAPVAFLAAITVAVLLVRSGLDGRDGATPAATATTTSVAVTERTLPEPPTQTNKKGARFYRIRPGDTLEGIAAQFGTSVEALLELNPKVDPVALTVGQRIRVG